MVIHVSHLFANTELIVFNRKEKLMRCSQCRIAKYCSAKCQKKAWPDHKQECKCLKSCKPRYPPDSVRLLARVIVKLMDEKPSESEKLYSFYDLESNINKLTEDKKEGLRQLALTFQHFTREEIQDASQLPPSFDLFEAFAKAPQNWGGLEDAAFFFLSGLHRCCKVHMKIKVAEVEFAWG
ncbi:SET and MYND domain containing 3 [Cricetulus griseus]